MRNLIQPHEVMTEEYETQSPLSFCSAPLYELNEKEFGV